MQLGEFELIARIRERLGEPRDTRARAVSLGGGDDAAITLPRGATATSIDSMVDGVHFERSKATPRQIGHKCLAGALSDLAAMGALPGEAYVALAVPPDLEEAECLELADGIAAVARSTGTDVLGGDVVRSPVLAITVTVVGHAPAPSRLIGRAGARVGDLVALTGTVGGAAGGLALLRRPELEAALPPGAADRLRGRLREPAPRIDAGAALARARVRAMIDVSDGVGADAGHIAAASGVRIEIDLPRLPLEPGLAELATAMDSDPQRLAAGGGEDYELLVTLPEHRLEEAAGAAVGAGVDLTVIGTVSRGSGAELRDAEGVAIRARGFDQLRDAARSPR